MPAAIMRWLGVLRGMTLICSLFITGAGRTPALGPTYHTRRPASTGCVGHSYNASVGGVLPRVVCRDRVAWLRSQLGRAALDPTILEKVQQIK